MNRQNRGSAQKFVALALLLIALIAAGCGAEEATPTPAPTPVPPTVAPTVTATTAPTVAATATTVADATATLPAPASADSYPAPSQTATDVATPADLADYPAPGASAAPAVGVTPDSYPAPVEPTAETSSIPIVPFVFERPLEPGATVVRGTGPANVPIVIVDVFLMGETLGEGIIDADGRFEVTVTPLETGHWVGVGLGDLTGTELTYADFYAQGFRGEGAEQVPQVGFVYDSEFVR